MRILVRGLVAFLILGSLQVGAQNVNIELVGRVPLEQFGAISGPGTTGADIWTYTDGEGRPYALATTSNGLAAFDLTDPTQPRMVGAIPSRSSLWQDVKTYTYPDGRSYAFKINQEFLTGVQVIDLNDLPNSLSLATTYLGVSRAHNIFIHPDAQQPYAYVCVTGNGPAPGLHILDISDPLNIVKVAHWQDFPVHDAYVYHRWADPEWDGKEVGIVWTEQHNMAVIDLTDKTNPRTLATLVYPGLSYSHSGWMDRTYRYMFSFDEGDEFAGVNTTMRVMDMNDIDNPGVLSVWRGPSPAIDHNGFTMGDYVYLGNYTRGFTLLDVHDPTSPVDIAYYDTYPDSDDTFYAGAWAGMPFLGKGLVAVNDYTSGLYILQVNFQPDPKYTERRYVPLNPEQLDAKAWLRMINPADTDAEVEIIPMNKDGVGTMRAVRTIPAGGMLYQELAEMFHPAPTDFNWVVVASDRAVAVSVEGIASETAMATPATEHLASKLNVPHIAADTANFFTRANVVNGGGTVVDVAVDTADGQRFELDQISDPNTGEYFDFETLFGGTVDANRTVATLQAELDGAPESALAGSEIFGGKEVAQLAGLTLGDGAATTLVFSHIARVDLDWWTGIAVVNPGADVANVTLSAYDGTGAVVASGTHQLAAGAKLLDFVSSGSRAPTLIEGGIPETAQWLKVTSDQPVTGYELFSDSQIRLFAGLGAGTEASSQLVLPFGGNSSWYAGIAVVNPAEVAQTVSFTLIDSDGLELNTQSQEVPANGRFVKTASELFGSLPEGQTWVRVHSDGSGVHGFVLYGDNAVNWLCGINGIAY